MHTYTHNHTKIHKGIQINIQAYIPRYRDVTGGFTLWEILNRLHYRIPHVEVSLSDKFQFVIPFPWETFDNFGDLRDLRLFEARGGSGYHFRFGICLILMLDTLCFPIINDTFSYQVTVKTNIFTLISSNSNWKIDLEMLKILCM